MQTFSPTDQHRQLAAMIAESLSLSDSLGLHRVGIGLNDALEQLTGFGYAPPGTEPAVNAA